MQDTTNIVQHLKEKGIMLSQTIDPQRAQTINRVLTSGNEQRIREFYDAQIAAIRRYETKGRLSVADVQEAAYIAAGFALIQANNNPYSRKNPTPKSPSVPKRADLVATLIDMGFQDGLSGREPREVGSDMYLSAYRQGQEFFSRED